LGKEDLFKCFCESRRIMNYFAQKLDSEELGTNEKDLLYDLISDSQKISNKIYKFCKKYE